MGNGLKCILLEGIYLCGYNLYKYWPLEGFAIFALKTANLSLSWFSYSFFWGGDKIVNSNL